MRLGSRTVEMSRDDERALARVVELVRHNEREFASGLEMRDLLVPLEDLIARFHAAPEGSTS